MSEDPSWRSYFGLLAQVNNNPEWGGKTMSKNFDPLVRRFVEEARIGGRLQHPGVVPVHENGSALLRVPASSSRPRAAARRARSSTRPAGSPATAAS